MKPNQYTKGYVEFYKLRFKVTPDVLIPRPETELLVDEVLKFVQSEQTNKLTNHQLIILDLGTGSGNIAISLACNLSGYNVNIIATDISQKALKVAKQNAKLHAVDNQITFVQSNLLNVIARSNSDEAIFHGMGRLPRSPRRPRNDNLIIVANLPYIPTERIPYLDPSVKDFEPHIALDGGEDGFELYRKLFKQIKAKMNQISAGVESNSTNQVRLGVNPPAGRAGTNPPHSSLSLRAHPSESKTQGWTLELIIGEVDYTHGELAVNEAQKYFPDAYIEVKKDLAYLQRILTIKFY